ncbi:MAG: DNA polymerase ligase N-terminal domain-containing protein [Vicinamibacterales bacterium]
MALEEYRARRNFKKTPEPPGRPAAATRKGKRAFSVQKHLASHLHYDIRLEHRGVLLSWAVPKGPSLDPRERRLAMRVEDHPVEYGDFEGVIPEGYGAGIVLLWDAGYWVPEVDDVDRALEKGDLKFRLEGYKLKGSWVLVRTRGAGDRGWLLIKHRDEWSIDTEELNITAFAPLSVKSNGDFADVLAADNPSVWLSNRPAPGGRAGAMFERIVERALSLREQSGGDKPGPTPSTGESSADPGSPRRRSVSNPANAAAGRGAARKRKAVARTTGSVRRPAAAGRKAPARREDAARRRAAAEKTSRAKTPRAKR